jgi:putative Mn2+ efflux pump MntP
VPSLRFSDSAGVKVKVRYYQDGREACLVGHDRRRGALWYHHIGIGIGLDGALPYRHNGAYRNLRLHAFLIAGFFGIFQALMPLIGWAAGLSFSSLIENFDHWVAFGLLASIGGKMVWESLRRKGKCEERNCLHLPTLLLLSLATSIDALAVGLSFAMLEIGIVRPILIIGGITFVICFAGLFLGNRVGHFFENKLELAGGLILIGIGVKILVEHHAFV